MQKRQTTKPRQLLYSRAQAAELLGGISINTVRRLEAEGYLTLVRLTRIPTGMVFFRAADVEALVVEALVEESAGD